MDELRIHGLEATAVIGARSWERQLRQRLVIDLMLETDARAAAADDALADALDYGAVARQVLAFTESSTFELIESLAEAIAALLLEEFSVRAVCVTVTKPGGVANAAGVSIRIERPAGAVR